MIHPDRPLSLREIGFKIRPIRGEGGRVRSYIEPAQVRVAIHPDVAEVPFDEYFGPRQSFGFPGGIRLIKGVVHAMVSLPNQMVGFVSLDKPLFKNVVTTDSGRQKQETVDWTLRRNRRHAGRMLPTKKLGFPRYVSLTSLKK